MDQTELLFVYGTLRPPLPDSELADSFNYPKAQPFVRGSKPAVLHGADLYDLGSFPAAIPGDGLLHGVLLEIDPAAFALLDPLEGHPDLYHRETVQVESGEVLLEAWIYWAPVDLAEQGVKLENGDWLRR